MISIVPIKTDNEKMYSYMEKLIVASFPEDEYRALDQLKKYTDAPNEFTNQVITEDGKMIGLLTYWDFGDFAYIEHFATDPEVRNGGYGRKIMEEWCRICAKPVVLEVEEPIEEMAKRRVGFYERLGYKLWNAYYEQPPYKKGDNFLPMKIMAYGNLKCEEDFERVKAALYKHVYGYGL